MLDYDGRSSTETTCRAETGGDGSDQHINFGSGDVVEFGKTTTGPSNSSEREGFIENEAVLVLVFEFNLWRNMSKSITREAYQTSTPISANRPWNRHVQKCLR
jgi:hypothetical protein